MKSLFYAIPFCLFAFPLNANSITKIWEAIENKDRAKARVLIQEAQKNEATIVDASLILLLLNIIEEKEENLTITAKLLPKLITPNPYLYALWHGEGFTNGPSKKEPKREKFLLDLLKSGKLNAAMEGSLRYLLGMSYGYSNNFEAAKEVWRPIQDWKDWQFVGPFDNTSGSGFHKHYGPINKPLPETLFTSYNNAPIKWFTPQTPDFQPWVGTEYFIPEEIAVIYAQTFMDLTEEQELIFATGFTGNIKIWVNDKLILHEEEELRTDLDFMKAKIRIPKGNNRVLVQLGYTKKSSYPNFMLRVFDKDGQPVSGNHSSQYKPYNKGEISLVFDDYPHFAESFFTIKIEEAPKNILNHILLAKSYYRSDKFNKAITILKKAIEIYPNNIFIHFELMLNYTAINDRTKISKQVELMRKIDPEGCFFSYYDYEVHKESQDFPQLEKYLNQMKSCYGEDSEDYLLYYTNWLTAKKDYQKLMEVAELAYEKYPENQTFLIYKFNILNAIRQEPEQAIELFENYLTKNCDFKIYKRLKSEYFKQKNKKKEEEVLLKMHNFYPADGSSIVNLMKYYYRIENFEKALFYTNKGLGNAPYKAGYWSDRAYINQALENKQAAIQDLKKSLKFNPNGFKNRKRLRELENKPSINSMVRDKDRVELITKHLEKSITSEENFEYLFYDISRVIYPEGPSSEFYSAAWQIYSKAGIEKWKESNIPKSDNKQNLIFERAEVYKKNGEEVLAERNGNEFVFVSLEIGDVIFIEYRLDNYKYGNLAKEYWGKYTFDDFIPIAQSRFRLFVDEAYPVYFEYKNFNQTPEKKTINDFICYDWTLIDLPPIKNEKYMPALEEVGKTISVSSIKSWAKIANWYHDLALPQAKEDYNLQPIYDEIFSGNKPLSDKEKAKAIYKYICENIQYSSVSFRQSNYVPQKPMITISTKLGDCKDVSTLYHTLAKKAGLSSNLVLVNTRNNGEGTILQPSIDFNHCIIKINLPGGPLYQELTDNNLPFGAIPNTIQNAQALVIPNSNGLNKNVNLINIPYNPLLKNELKRKVQVKIENSTLIVSTDIELIGKPASSYRNYFSNLTKEETKEKISQLLDDYFEGDLFLDKYEFINLDNIQSKMFFATDFKVEKDVLSIGGINAIKPPFMELLFSLDAFSKEERTHPLQYWRYEDYDYYETEIILELPPDSEIVELPNSLIIKNEIIDYQLVVEKLNSNKLKLSRKAKLHRVSFSKDFYVEFRKTIKQIMETENTYIAFK